MRSLIDIMDLEVSEIDELIKIAESFSDAELKSKLCEKKYDIVAANIVADVLKAMSGHFADFLKEDGTLVISGIISERCKEVTDVVCGCGFKIIEEKEEGDWSCVVLKRA